MDGAVLFRTPPTILPPPTTSSGPVFGCTSRNVRGRGRTRYIGANRSSDIAAFCYSDTPKLARWPNGHRAFFVACIELPSDLTRYQCFLSDATDAALG